MQVRSIFGLLFMISSLLWQQAFADSPTYTTMQTRIITPAGTPLEASSVNFRFTILDSSGTCILYSEDFSSINMSGTQGMATFALGGGVRSYPTGAVSMTSVFNNSSSSTFPCQAGGSYIPNPTDRRELVMQFNDGNGWQTLPQTAINSVFYADYATRAEKLGDFPATDYIRMAAFPVCTGSQVLTWNGTVFSCVTGGGGGTGTVTSVSGTAPISVATGSSTPVISIPPASASASGYLSSADWTAFNAKASASLPPGKLYLGSASGDATGVSLSGDATLANTGVMTLANSGVSAGTYGGASAVPSFTVDAKGRITTAVANAYQDASNVNKGVVQIGTNITLNSGVISVTSSDITNALGFTPANASGTSVFINGGNAFSADASLGTTSNYGLNFLTNNTTAMTIDTSGRVGIGTVNSPTTKLSISANSSPLIAANAGSNLQLVGPDASSNAMTMDAFGTSNWHSNWITLRRAQGTAAAPSFPLSGNYIGDLQFQGWTGSGFGGGALIESYVTENWTATTTGSGVRIGVIPKGSTAAFPMLDVTGDSLVVGGSDRSIQTWTTAGRHLQVQGRTLTDTTGTGTTTLKVASSFAAPAFASTSAMTVTNAANLYIAGAPTAGANTTITNASSLYVAAGTSFFGGNVGIGTSTPAGILDVRGGTAASGNGQSINIVAQNSGTNASGGNIFLTPGTGNGAGQPAGAVQISQSSTGTLLQVYRNATDNYASTAGTVLPSTNTKFGNGWYAVGNSAIQGFTVRNATNDQNAYFGAVSTSGGYTPAFVFGQQTGASTYSEKMRLDSSGNLGLGTTTPSYTLHVVGNIYATGTITQSSDRRWKKDIGLIPDALTKVEQLRGVYYNWREDEFPQMKFSDARQMGVVAQEVETVFPEAVSTDKNTGFKSVAYSLLVAPLIEAVKELNAKIEALGHSKAEASVVAVLQQENAELKARATQVEKQNSEQAEQLQAMKAYLCAKDKNAPVCN